MVSIYLLCSGPDIESHNKPIESENPFLAGDLINQNEQCWLLLRHSSGPAPAVAPECHTRPPVKLRRHARKRDSGEDNAENCLAGLNCFRSPARKRRPESWLGVSLASQAPRPYTSKPEDTYQPSSSLIADGVDQYLRSSREGNNYLL